MKLYERIEQILRQLHSAFSREATLEWFVLLFWGVVLSTQVPAVTSYLNALGLGESCYHRALHWFHSSAFSVDGLCEGWGKWLSDHEQVYRLRGQRLYVGDEINGEGRTQDARAASISAESVSALISHPTQTWLSDPTDCPSHPSASTAHDFARSNPTLLLHQLIADKTE